VGAYGLCRVHQLLIVGALVLLTISAVGLAANSTKVSPVDAQASTSRSSYQSPPRFTVFLVQTQADADALKEREAAFARERELEGLEGRLWRYRVLVAGSAIDDFIAMDKLRDIRAQWQSAGASGLEVVDLR
jgi:hypothetical protein